ncbi:MAG: DnaD domain protein [Chloroflexi bacterium]|nr:DnaD domain protein [Chloroflexota bacterium]
MGKMNVFPGFPPGPLRATPLPDEFFSRLLPEMDDLAELKLILHVWWLITRQRGPIRAVSTSQLHSDTTLLAGLSREALESAVVQAVARGVLLQVSTQPPAGLSQAEATQSGLTTQSGEELWLLANTAEGRRTVERLRRGEITLDGQTFLPPLPAATPPVEVPNIFALYEQNIGSLQPVIAEVLREATELYAAEWIVEAFKIAAAQNVRNWAYINAILERWRIEGKVDAIDQGSPAKPAYTTQRKRDGRYRR